MILSSSCASSLKASPRLENRTLRISKDFPGFEYRYCIKKHWFTGDCTKWQIDKYDLRDDTTRQKLIDMGFVARVRKKF